MAYIVLSGRSYVPEYVRTCSRIKLYEEPRESSFDECEEPDECGECKGFCWRLTAAAMVAWGVAVCLRGFVDLLSTVAGEGATTDFPKECNDQRSFLFLHRPQSDVKNERTNVKLDEAMIVQRQSSSEM